MTIPTKYLAFSLYFCKRMCLACPRQQQGRVPQGSLGSEGRIFTRQFGCHRRDLSVVVIKQSTPISTTIQLSHQSPRSTVGSASYSGQAAILLGLCYEQTDCWGGGITMVWVVISYPLKTSVMAELMPFINVTTILKIMLFLCFKSIDISTHFCKPMLQLKLHVSIHWSSIASSNKPLRF